MPDFEIFNGNTKKLLKMFKHDNIFLIFVILLAIVIGILVAISIIFYSSQQNSSVIQTGIFIKGVNVSGCTKEEAIALVEKKLKYQMNDHIELTYKNCNYYVDIEQIEAKFDIESSVNFALSIAKTGNIFKDIKQYINVFFANIDIEPKLTYNDEALTSYLDVIEANLPDQLKQPDYYIEDGKLIVINGVNGAGIEYDQMKTIILSAIQDISYSNGYIQIPTYTQYPDEINVDQIHNGVYREMENAYFTTEPYAVFAEVTGVDFDTKKLTNLILDNPKKEEYVVELDYTKPDITVNDLGKEAFPDLLATYSTKYSTSNTARTTNLKLAASKIDGYVLMPGKEFSYNRVVGKRTVSAGYKEAAIYENGQVTSGLGGGICQISTTLYNAAIGADMKITSRRNHMFVPSYVTGGKDATVVWGATDFKFKNDREYPIKIEASVSNGTATISIYGLRTDNEYDDISIETKTIKKTADSLIIDSYKVYKKNGEVVKRDKLYRDTYKSHP